MKTKGRGTAAQEYEDKGFQMAIELFVNLRMRTASIATSADLREAIEALPGDQLLQTTIGDFWLGLTKGGPARVP